MLTKGIIVNKLVDNNHYIIRIPLLESASDLENSNVEATLAYTSGIVESFKPDDVVIVGFEEHNANRPIIIGKLFLPDDIDEPRGFANFESLNVSKSVTLPDDTTIGGQSLKNLPNILDYLLSRDSGGDSPTPPTPVVGDTPVVGIIKDTLTNINGRVLSSYESNLITISGYQCYKITYGGETLTENRARSYLEAMCGSSFLPTYNYNIPKNTYLLTFDGLMLKPQFDYTNGLVLYLMQSIATKKWVEDKNYVTYTATNDLDMDEYDITDVNELSFSNAGLINVDGNNDMNIATSNGDIILNPDGIAKYNNSEIATKNDIDNFVPYTGAAQDVDLGNFELSADKVNVGNLTIEQTNTNSFKIGANYQDSLTLDFGSVTIQGDDVATQDWVEDQNYLTSDDISNLVPYTGATDDLDLGSNDLIFKNNQDEEGRVSFSNGDLYLLTSDGDIILNPDGIATYGGYELATLNNLLSYLPLSGGTLTGDLGISQHKLQLLGDQDDYAYLECGQDGDLVLNLHNGRNDTTDTYFLLNDGDDESHYIATRDWVVSQDYLVASDIANMVTTNTQQEITGAKTFSTLATFKTANNNSASLRVEKEVSSPGLRYADFEYSDLGMFSIDAFASNNTQDPQQLRYIHKILDFGDMLPLDGVATYTLSLPNETGVLATRTWVGNQGYLTSQDIVNLVPYTGAINDLNLGIQALLFGNHVGFNGIRETSNNIEINSYDGNIILNPDGLATYGNSEIATKNDLTNYVTTSTNNQEISGTKIFTALATFKTQSNGNAPLRVEKQVTTPAQSYTNFVYSDLGMFTIDAYATNGESDITRLHYVHKILDFGEFIPIEGVANYTLTLPNETGTLATRTWVENKNYLTSQDIVNLVPYTGATNNLDLGSNQLKFTANQDEASIGLNNDDLVLTTSSGDITLNPYGTLFYGSSEVATKSDLNNYVTLDTAQTITGTKTYRANTNNQILEFEKVLESPAYRGVNFKYDGNLADNFRIEAIYSNGSSDVTQLVSRSKILDFGEWGIQSKTCVLTLPDETATLAIRCF